MLDTRRDATENQVSIDFLGCKGLSIDDVGLSRDTVVQEIRPGAGFETSDFVREKLGGATVKRLTIPLTPTLTLTLSISLTPRPLPIREGTEWAYPSSLCEPCQWRGCILERKYLD